MSKSTGKAIYLLEKPARIIQTAQLVTGCFVPRFFLHGKHRNTVKSYADLEYVDFLPKSEKIG
jgi:hypothetical protein